MTGPGPRVKVGPRVWQNCGVCGFPLEHRGGQWFHVRALFEGEDHVAVPVSEHDLPANQRCDICDGFPATLEVDAEDFVMPYTDAISCHGWALCDVCGPILTRCLKERSARRLVRRAMESRTVRGIATDRDSRRWLSDTYERLLLHVTSEVRPIT